MRRGILFPVMLLDEVEIPLEFEHLQAAHLMDWQPDQDHAGFDQFIDDIAQLIGHPTNSVIQQPPVNLSQEPPPAPTSPTPEPDREPLPQHTDDVEPAGVQLDEQPSDPDTIARVVSPDAPTAPVGTDEEPPAASSPPTPDREVAAKSRKSKRRGTRPRVTGAKPSTAEARAVAQDSADEPIVSPEPTEGAELIRTDHSAGADYSDYPTHPVVSTSSFSFLPIGLGLLAAIGALVYFVVFSHGPSPQYQSTTPSPNPPTEMMRPPTQPAPAEKPPMATPQAKPTTTQATTATKTTDTKSRQTARPSKTEESSTQATVAKSQSAVGSPKNITGQDGAPMVLIPAGEFMMGSPDGEGDKDEHPQHRVGLSAFYLDKYEVTNRRFEQFVSGMSYQTTAEQEGKAWALTATGKYEEVNGAYWKKPEGSETVSASNRDDHPVVSVSWIDAQAYCRWAGKRLPTEAEFEYATRAGTETKYWWGNGNPGSRQVANIADESATRQYSGWSIMTGYDDGYVRTAPVGSFEANPFGLHDMTGNVWEWTADWYEETYYSKGAGRNPTGPANGEYRVLRGGSWGVGPSLVRSADRSGSAPAGRGGRVGFRCAQDIPK